MIVLQCHRSFKVLREGRLPSNQVLRHDRTRLGRFNDHGGFVLLGIARREEGEGEGEGGGGEKEVVRCIYIYTGHPIVV